jgi:hypothetical protein
MRITLQTRLHEQARNKDKLNPSPKNIRMLVKQAIERGIEPYKHIFANIQQWEYPEHLNDKQALNFAKCMQAVTIGEVDQIIKEETNA